MSQREPAYCEGYRDALIWVVKMLDADLFDNGAIRDSLKRGLIEYPIHQATRPSEAKPSAAI